MRVSGKFYPDSTKISPPPLHLPDHPPLGDGRGIPYTNTVWYHIIRNLLLIMTHYRILALVVSLEPFHPLVDLSEPIQLPFLTTHKAKTRRFGKFPSYTAKKTRRNATTCINTEQKLPSLLCY